MSYVRSEFVPNVRRKAADLTKQVCAGDLQHPGPRAGGRDFFRPLRGSGGWAERYSHGLRHGLPSFGRFAGFLSLSSSLRTKFLLDK